MINNKTTRIVCGKYKLTLSHRVTIEATPETRPVIPMPRMMDNKMVIYSNVEIIQIFC
jgi:hypothetical protein